MPQQKQKPHNTMWGMKQHEIHELYIKKTFEDGLCMLPLHVVIWCMNLCSGCMLACYSAEA